MKDILQTNQYYNRNLIRNNRITAAIIFYFQIAIIVLYAIFVIPTPTLPNNYDQQLLITIGVAVLVNIGFGLIFSIAKNKIWSSLGFTFFITVITFQLYFLVSGFWTLVGISNRNNILTWGNKLPVYLTSSTSQQLTTYGNTAVQAFKCSLANSIAFAAISGRAGILEAMIISLFGTVLYELNNQLVSHYSMDIGGSMTIFCFGGFLGSTISIILYYCKQDQVFYQHEFRYSNQFSYLFAAIGALFCWVFFPFLNIDISLGLVFNYSAAINTLYCISACVVTSISLTCIINGKISLRDMIFSPVAGGVAAGSSSAIINSAFSALLLGVGTALFMVLLLKLDKITRWHIVVQNFVFYLYAVIGGGAGLISSIFIYQSSLDSIYTNQLNYPLASYTQQPIGVGISAGIGIVGGLILSPIICLVNSQKKRDFLHDHAYWIIEQDGMSTKRQVQQTKKEASLSQEESKTQTVYFQQIIIKNPRSSIKDKYSYL